MKRIVKPWTIEKLCKEKDKFSLPEYQREPHLWSREEKSDLIDSILKGLDVPKIYFYKLLDAKGNYEVVDGQQRLEAIWGFYNNEFKLKTGEYFTDLKQADQRIIREYELQVTEIIEAKDSELRLLFLRLQLGELLNTGEKLKAQTGIVKDFIFKRMVLQDFIRGINISERRFAKQTLCAQICINSYWKEKNNSFCRTRYIDLEDFFKKCNEFKGEDLKFLNKKFEEIISTLAILKKAFHSKLKILTNRSFILSLYLLVEEFMKNNQTNEMSTCVKFVEYLLKELKAEMKKGFHREKEEFYIFESYLSNAPGEKYQIQRRHDKLKEFFAEFKISGAIKGNKKNKSGS